MSLNIILIKIFLHQIVYVVSLVLLVQMCLDSHKSKQ